MTEDLALELDILPDLAAFNFDSTLDLFALKVNAVFGFFTFKFDAELDHFAIKVDGVFDFVILELAIVLDRVVLVFGAAPGSVALGSDAMFNRVVF